MTPRTAQFDSVIREVTRARDAHGVDDRLSLLHACNASAMLAELTAYLRGVASADVAQDSQRLIRALAEGALL